MTSPARIAANRRNAQRSTGPRTPEGKARSSQNSLRHGLSAKTRPQSGENSAIVELARNICGPEGDHMQMALAIDIAEALSHADEVRSVRSNLLQAPTAMPSSPTNQAIELAQMICALQRYERAANARVRKAISRFCNHRDLAMFAQDISDVSRDGVSTENESRKTVTG